MQRSTKSQPVGAGGVIGAEPSSRLSCRLWRSQFRLAQLDGAIIADGLAVDGHEHIALLQCHRRIGRCLCHKDAGHVFWHEMATAKGVVAHIIIHERHVGN